MFISTDTDLINTAHITSAHFEPAKQAENPDDWDADENGVIAPTLTIYFPCAAADGGYGRTSFEFTGAAATETWERLLSESGTFVLRVPTCQPIDRDAKRQKREAARAAQSSVDDLPW